MPICVIVFVALLAAFSRPASQIPSLPSSVPPRVPTPVPSPEELKLEANRWRVKMVQELYHGVSDRELDEATRWIRFAEPFLPTRTTKLASLPAKEETQLDDRLEYLKEVQSDLVNAPGLQSALLVQLTYHSNRMEGNTLSLYATTLIIMGKRLSPSPRIPDEHLYVSAGKDINETKNHANLLRYLGLLQPGLPSPLITGPSISWRQLLKDINRFLLKGTELKVVPGQWRRHHVGIVGKKTLLPQVDEVPRLMEMFEAWLNEGLPRVQNDRDAIALAADAHAKFVHIHPFGDGNGRTARLLDALILNRYGLPPPIFDGDNRGAYMEAIGNATREDPFWDLVPFARVHRDAIMSTIKIIEHHPPLIPTTKLDL